ncbi:hypothetical protein APSETT444_001965 [Aspergillus pseudonomiae]
MLALVGQHIKVKRGAALGIVLGGSSLGGVIWPIAINELLQKPHIGFGWTMRIVAFIMIPLLSVSCICCRPPKLSPTPTQRPASDDQEATISKANPSVTKMDLSVLKKPSLQLSCLAFFIIYFGMFSPFFFTTSYAVTKGFSTDLAFYTISIVNGASFFGRVLPGIVADRALAGVPISGELAGKYGYLALSIYSGVSLLVGSVLLAAARFVQRRDLLAIV